MTGKSISWDEIEAIFARCGEIHVSPNIAQAIEAATAGETPQSGSTEGESAVGESRCAQTAPKGAI